MKSSEKGFIKTWDRWFIWLEGNEIRAYENVLYSPKDAFFLPAHGMKKGILLAD